jgi:hypothetical protein
MNTRRPICLVVSLMLPLIFIHAAVAQEVAVVQSVICRNVIDRMPVESGAVIPAGTQRVFCFTQIEGAQGETEITHNWYHGGILKASVVLPVRTSSWRTWSSKALMPEWTGEWLVEVLAQDGTPLERVVFTVE